MKQEIKKALVVGLGASGITAIRFLHSQGWQVKAIDTRSTPPQLPKLQAELPDVKFRGGEITLDMLEDESLLVLSPGISPYFSAVAPLVTKAKQNGIDVVGEIELFARHLQTLADTQQYKPKIIAITGTNGKTTTTMLTSVMVREAGFSVCTAGNVGPNALAELQKLEAAHSLPDYWVLELSSFQLDTTSSLFCDSAALLNVTEDHLDWHGGMQAYAAAKARIFSQNTIRVLNREDSLSLQFGDSVPVSQVRTFGQDAPIQAGQFGLQKDGVLSWLAYRDDDNQLQLLIPDNALKIRGTHNKMNALSASALALSAGIPTAAVQRALDSYQGEPHRVQHVLISCGIEYFDDSKGTNVGATKAALDGFNDRKVVVILGGDGKGQNFSPLAEAVQAHARGVVLIGRDAGLIETALKDCTVEIRQASDMKEAVAHCRAMALSGDAVLLSPACASWDMFRDYADRSEQFIACAKAIAMDEGCLC